MKAKIKPRIQLEGREPLGSSIPLSTPWVIFVDPSDICNFNCRFCPSGDLDLLRKVGRKIEVMEFNLYKKIIKDICEFDKPIKVLRLYKDGEPLLNKNFADMIKYAKESGCCDKIDTTTNASMLNPERNLEIIEAGLDRINISIEGVDDEQYVRLSNYRINFDEFVKNIEHFYDNRNGCEMIIKINGDLILEEDKQKFYDIFGDICDGISIEHTMGCWYGFDMGDIKPNNKLGIYGQPLQEVDVCPYVFYSMSINSNGTASLCFLDWARKLLIGDVKKESVKDIWNGDKLRKYQELFLQNKRKEHPICSNCMQLSYGMPVDLDKHSKELFKKLRGRFL
jgi:radical SAM protein with 4Fe4S-binding SPASM domain